MVKLNLPAQLLLSIHYFLTLHRDGVIYFNVDDLESGFNDFEKHPKINEYMMQCTVYTLHIVTSPKWIKSYPWILRTNHKIWTLLCVTPCLNKQINIYRISTWSLQIKIYNKKYEYRVVLFLIFRIELSPPKVWTSDCRINYLFGNVISSIRNFPLLNFRPTAISGPRQLFIFVLFEG